MSELEYWNSRLAGKLNEAHVMVEGLARLPVQEREVAIKRATLMLDDISTQTMKQVKHQLRGVEDVVKKRAYDKRLKADESTLGELKRKVVEVSNQLKWESASADKKDLFAGGNAGGANGGPRTRDAAIQETKQTQDQITKSLANTIQMVKEAEETGVATAAKVDAQNKQIIDINTNVQGIDTELDRARDVMKAFAKRVMTDRVLLVFLVLIFLGVIGIVIYFIINPDSSKANIPEAAIPPFAQRSPTPSPA